MAADELSRRELLYSLMGDLPERDRPVAAHTVSITEHPSYILEKLVLDLNGVEPVPAYLTRPKGSGRFPAVLFHHAHGGNYEVGKDELLFGRHATQKPPYAEFLASMNIAALCIDTWAFGERRGRSESEIFKEMLWRGQVMWGMMVFDNLKALDYLVGRADIDAGRIGTGGISMGSTMAWWTAALDTRIKATFDMCCLTDFASLIETRGLDGHGIYYFVPGLLKHFSTAQINDLIAPRAHLSLAGIYDRLTPPVGLDIVDEHLKKTYAGLNAGRHWELVRYHAGHFENADMRERVRAFLEEHLLHQGF